MKNPLSQQTLSLSTSKTGLEVKTRDVHEFIPMVQGSKPQAPNPAP
jgi:hypothetical protein